MRILFALPPTANPLIQELSEALQELGAEATINIEDFWNKKGGYDIIHIHWPEALCYWKEPDENMLCQLESVLAFWKNCSKLLVTRHNIYPHKGRTVNYINLYQLVYTYADAVVHMGKFSLRDYKERYHQVIPDFARQLQSLIPHTIYKSFPNEVSSLEARKKLGISQNSFVVLVFGKVRNSQEAKFIYKTFKKLRDKDKVLLVPHWHFADQWITNKFEHFLNRFHPRYLLTSRRMENEEVQYFFNAADIIFIQRFDNLNSGNLILGFSFGKVVVGSDFGVAGEILTQSGNPTFRVGNVKDAADAIEHAKKLVEQGKGNRNLDYAHLHWNHDKISKAYLRVYNSVLQQ